MISVSLTFPSTVFFFLSGGETIGFDGGYKRPIELLCSVGRQSSLGLGQSPKDQCWTVVELTYQFQSA